MSRRATLSIVGATWASFAILGLSAVAGLHINATPSMPRGIWHGYAFAGAVRPGDAVVVCLPPTEPTRRYIAPGPCRNGLEPLLKTVGAVAGDVVTLGPSGVAVNGVDLAQTAPLAADTAGRVLVPYPPGRYQVRAGQIYLFSSHSANSYDSRYFGPVQTTTIQTVARPVFTIN